MASRFSSGSTTNINPFIKEPPAKRLSVITSPVLGAISAGPVFGSTDPSTSKSLIFGAKSIETGDKIGQVGCFEANKNQVGIYFVLM